jgi:hypothetical protein
MSKWYVMGFIGGLLMAVLGTACGPESCSTDHEGIDVFRSPTICSTPQTMCNGSHCIPCGGSGQPCCNGSSPGATPPCAGGDAGGLTCVTVCGAVDCNFICQ